MYLTYNEYKDMGGELDETAFKNFAEDAEIRISKETFKRIYNVDADTEIAVKRCIVKITDMFKSNEDVFKKEKVTSFSHDGLSQSFSMPTVQEYSERISCIICDFLEERYDLNGIPLLYRGCSV